jgi:hypothetical protein
VEFVESLLKRANEICIDQKEALAMKVDDMLTGLLEVAAKQVC